MVWSRWVARAGVGWAAGVERLAMLCEESTDPRLAVIVVAEDDDVLDQAMAHLAKFRRAGIAADLVATGSSRKRFDKAVKSNPLAIESVRRVDGKVVHRLKMLGDDMAAHEARLLAVINAA